MPAKGTHVSPEGKERMRLAAARRWADPDYVAKFSASRRALYQDPAYRERITESIRAAMRRPEVHARMVAAARDPERCAKIGASSRGRKDPPEVAAKKGRPKGYHISETHRAILLRASHTWPPEKVEKVRQARLRQYFPQKATKIEQALEAEFQKRRLKFEMHKSMFGRFQPDFVFENVRLVVQADGDYWHSHQVPRSLARDARFNAAALSEGWTVWRFSENEILGNPAACGRAVATFIRSHKPRM